MVVEEVVLAFDLVHPSTGQLHEGDESGKIGSSRKKITIFILQIFDIDFEDELPERGTEVAEVHGDSAIFSVLAFIFGVGCGEAGVDILAWIVGQEVGVDDSGLHGLVGPVEELQRVSSDQLIIAVYVDDYGIFLAVVDGAHVNVVHSSHTLVIFDIGVILFGNTMEGEIFAVGVSTTVLGDIIEDDHFEIGVILVEDGVETVLDAESGVIVVAGREDAHGQLGCDLV